uniref:Uncharacterized protein n=1 Tax=Aegilops tauschii subsp. strangulata TaxID=200361 RepID=A0A453IC28_AEGTS
RRRQAGQGGSAYSLRACTRAPPPTSPSQPLSLPTSVSVRLAHASHPHLSPPCLLRPQSDQSASDPNPCPLPSPPTSSKPPPQSPSS